MRILALDVGERRIGLAISDPLGTIAQPLMTMQRNDGSVDHIIEIVKDKEVGEIVVGLPVNMNGTSGKQVDEVNEFARLITERIDIPLVFVDERLTTVEAEKLMISADVNRRKRRQTIDSVAAAIILEKRLRDRNARGIDPADPD
ncbi:MAG: Holliday junction resolvase RuvX [Deltaproteobacteria bacterium]|nr:Holliday junction resolvase RuvX [Candidatus Zymogenaceae bacterium]